MRAVVACGVIRAGGCETSGRNQTSEGERRNMMGFFKAAGGVPSYNQREHAGLFIHSPRTNQTLTTPKD